MSLQRKAMLALFIVTIFWGATFPLIKISLAYISPGLFVTFRLSLSLLFFIPIIMKANFKHKKYLLKVGAIFGSLEGLSFYFQTHGLYTVSSSESPFLTALSVIMIPFIGSIFKLDRLTIYSVVASFVSLFGIYALSGASFNNFTIGYLWSILCALAYALSVVYLSYETRKDDNTEIFKDLRLLIILQIAFGIPIPLISDIPFMHLQLNYILLVSLAFCSIEPFQISV